MAHTLFCVHIKFKHNLINCRHTFWRIIWNLTCVVPQTVKGLLKILIKALFGRSGSDKNFETSEKSADLTLDSSSYSFPVLFLCQEKEIETTQLSWFKPVVQNVVIHKVPNFPTHFTRSSRFRNSTLHLVWSILPLK